MWSPLYRYYEIRSDAQYLQEVLSVEIGKIFEGTGHLLRTGNQTFTNAEGFPWIEIVYVKSNKGNFGVDARYTSKFSNLIAVVTSRYREEDEKRYLDVLLQIAKKLGWELVLEEDDEGNEDVVIWGQGSIS